ncbi:MAG: Holliday junction resolvase RuvX [Anaerolineae bacterium]
MRHMALDVGDERIGVALSDQRGYLARPFEIIARKSGPSSFLRIAEIVREHKVEIVVVGLPRLPDGSEGKQVRSTQAYVDGLKEHIDIPIVYHDEYGSTRRATEIMVENRSRKRRRQRASDALAAAVILQSYLDEQAGGPAL